MMRLVESDANTPCQYEIPDCRAKLRAAGLLWSRRMAISPDEGVNLCLHVLHNTK